MPEQPQGHDPISSDLDPLVSPLWLSSAFITCLALVAMFLLCGSIDAESGIHPAGIVIAVVLVVIGLLLALLSLVAIRKSGGRLWGKGATLFAVGLLLLTLPQSFCLFSIFRVRGAHGRTQTFNNAKMLAVAMNEYQDTFGTFPPSAVFDLNGQPLLSWRVLLLPFVEQEALFHEFRLDERWDSPHNLPLLKKMPAIYKTLDDDATRGLTGFQVFVGPGAAFEGEKGLNTWKDFSDGSEHTILLVQVSETVPWTAPKDLAFAPDLPLPKVKGPFSDGVVASFVDGTVHAIPPDISEATLRALITRNAGDHPGKDGDF